MSRRKDPEAEARDYLRQWFSFAACGGQANADDMEVFPPTLRPAVANYVRAIHARRQLGEYGEARKTARAAAEGIAGALPAGWEPPAEPQPDLSSMTPSELAEWSVPWR